MSSPKASAAGRPKPAASRPKAVARKLPAQKPAAAAPAGDLSAEAARLAAAIEAALAQGEAERLDSAAVQRLMAAVCRAYRAQIDAGANYLPLPPGSPVAPTDVMVTCGALLRAADLQVFELGMWQSFTGR